MVGVKSFLSREESALLAAIFNVYISVSFPSLGFNIHYYYYNYLEALPTYINIFLIQLLITINMTYSHSFISYSILLLVSNVIM